MAKYIYHGPPQSIPMRKGKDQFETLNLFPGRKTSDVNPQHPVIASLISSELLTEAPASKAAKPKEEK